MTGRAGRVLPRPGPTRVGVWLRETADRLRAAGLATAHQDAEILCGQVLDVSRLALHLHPEHEMGADHRARLDALVERRLGHEPLQYILGEESFRGLTLAVGPGVFIPRPETELLVQRALAACPAGPAVAVDLCTGSGAVACGLAAGRPALSVWAVDLSPLAVACARANVVRLGLGGRVRVLEGDLTTPLADPDLGGGLVGRVDLVVANPPYIARPALAELPAEVRVFEPALALDGGSAGLVVVTRILDEAPTWLRPGGRLLIEIGHAHAGALRRRLAGDARYGTPTFTRDLLGHERILDVECL